MNFPDREIIELNDLCGAVADAALTDAQRARLMELLRSSEAARRQYVRAMGQSASLHTYAAEIHAGAPDVPMGRDKIWSLPRMWSVGLAAAALVVGGLFLLRATAEGESSSLGQPSDVVARLTGAKNPQWSSPVLAPGAHLRKGRRLELTAGYIEITFDSGARVVLEGTASLEINSAWAATLRSGTLKASVPPEAIGFRISNAAVEVVDLGTEFTMIADAHGAEVLVLKGEVEAAPRAAEQDSILLREKESRRFAANGVSDVRDRDRKFALFSEPLALDRLTETVRVVHWSFDEAIGAKLPADSSDGRGSAFDAQLFLDASEGVVALTGGKRGRALRFDGQLYARASVPGISNSTPHTISFWVRVPEDAPLSDAYSMVTWTTRSRKLGNRHAGINWNRDRTEGPLGVLRTDFGGGHALGTTSLRDGRWHHVAVCFAPGDDQSDTPVQVRQYVDGRLESSTVIPGPTRGLAVAENAALADLVWLGRRLGPTGPRADRFRGELDELFIADRGLEPQEIVSLMNDNRLPVSALAQK